LTASILGGFSGRQRRDAITDLLYLQICKKPPYQRGQLKEEKKFFVMDNYSKGANMSSQRENKGGQFSQMENNGGQ
jgi:hypothetical protein